MKTQNGMSAMGLLFLLILGGFVALCLIKIGPLYYDNYKMEAILERVGSEGIPIESLTTSEIRGRLGAQFAVDGVRDINPNIVKIERDKGVVTLSYIHEDRVNLFGNLDVIVSFENRFSTADKVDN